MAEPSRLILSASVREPSPLLSQVPSGGSPSLSGSLGARTTIKQHLQAYLRFFSYLREHSAAKTITDLRVADIDGYEHFSKPAG